MSKCDLSHVQYGTDARNFPGYKKCRCLATSGDTSKQHEKSNDGRLYRHGARRALSSNRLCPMMHTGEGPFGVRLRTHNREVYHAYYQSVGVFDRGWRPAMAGEQLHTDGRFNQKDPEYRRSCCRGFMAFERFWDSALPYQSPRVKRSGFEC